MDSTQPSIQQVQHQYDVVMDTLAMKNNKEVEEFRREFSEIFQALTSSMESVMQQEKKIEDLRLESTRKTEEKLNISRSEEEFESIKLASQRTVQAIQIQIQERNEAEEKKKTQLVELQKEIEEQNLLREKGPGWTSVQEAQRRELLEQHEAVNRAVETQAEQLQTTKKDVEKLNSLVSDAESGRERVIKKIQEVEGNLQRMRESTAKQCQKKSQAEEKLQELQSITEESERVLAEKMHQVEAGDNIINEMDKELKEAKTEMEN
mmetsp:Transcript_25174/g.32843  ORF Transcript_25174/g.32843 Transcript_25174/m.32843 type:complete len:264 (+) Transcript_25174:67-858(+)